MAQPQDNKSAPAQPANNPAAIAQDTGDENNVADQTAVAVIASTPPPAARKAPDNFGYLGRVAQEFTNGIKTKIADTSNIVTAIHTTETQFTNSAIKWLETHASQRIDKYGGNCARFIREALEHAGIDTSGHQKPAASYIGFLDKKGFNRVEGWTAAKAQPGDIIVFEPNTHHKSGHIQMYAGGGKWYSDCLQSDINPNNRTLRIAPDYSNVVVYRANAANSLMASNTAVGPDAKVGTPASDVTTPVPRRAYQGNHRSMARNAADAVERHRRPTHGISDLASASPAGETPSRRHGGMGHRGFSHGPIA